MNRLRELRIERHKTQQEIADHLNLSQRAVSFYELGKRDIPNKVLQELADYLCVSTDEILGREPLRRGLLGNQAPPQAGSMEATVENIVRKILSEEEKKKKGMLIPVLGTIAAGVPVEAVEDILGWEEISESMASQGDYFALRVKGQSMEPKFIEGDTVIVRKESCVESGRVAVVLVGCEDATLKQVNISPEGIALIGYNPMVYEPHFYSNKEVQDLPVQILGEVVELRRKV